MRHCLSMLVTLTLLVVGIRVSGADDMARPRLVPFPKQVKLQQGSFALDRQLTLECSTGAVALLGRIIGDELKRAGLPGLTCQAVEGKQPFWRLSAGAKAGLPKGPFRDKSTPEDYLLDVRPDAVVCVSPGQPGLFNGAQTLVQLIRANRRDNAIRCLSISDWPSLRWRCFQDDMTRGPSSKLESLKHQIDLGSLLKMNLMTYYMEHQFHFNKHPVIGPKDGSLEPEDLKAWVAYARSRQMDVLGNQQSFGHFAHILRHEEYAHLRETGGILCPVKEESYKLLDDLYSEVCPLVPFPMFNVCCDETYGLGSGPSKELADKIGVGGVYLQHMRRVHDLLKQKHGKRMMMWGDIILKHPDHLDKIPKDTVMLTWGYNAKESFESQIIPFAKSGYEFFVCPGVSNWSRILPDFQVATVNIHNFVRDGAKHGALGMINTAWEDDGEALNPPRWHGDAWGAECAWNASTTTPEDFNRRLGGVLFGEPGDHFGQAIELLAKTHAMPGMEGMNNKRFWQDDFGPGRSASTVRVSAGRLLEAVRPAIEHLEACKKEATVNAEMLDYFIFGARRMELIGQRMLDAIEAVECYAEAYGAPREKASKLLARAEDLVHANREAHAALAPRFKQLWLAESKPYALDRTMDRYAALDERFKNLEDRLAAARKLLEAGKPLPPPEQVGLAEPSRYTRRRRPSKIESTPLAPKAAWAVPAAGYRLGISIGAGSAARVRLPVSIDVDLPPELADKAVRAFASVGQSPPSEIPVQLDAADKPAKRRLTLVMPGPIAKGAVASVHVYLGLANATEPLPEAVITSDAPRGMKWIENDKVRALLGPEGSHVYRWEVKAMKDHDMTKSGESNWAGWSDISQGHRNTAFQLARTAAGPAMVEYVCTAPSGLITTIRLFAGASWMEVMLSEGVGYYWDFDRASNFAADGPTPGTFLFSNGRSGPVGKQSEGVAAQVRVDGVRWAVKFNQQKLALGLITPEVNANFVLAPGEGSGGVGLERARPVSHFITFAGKLDAEPAETMGRLARTLAFQNQPVVVLHAVESKP